MAGHGSVCVYQTGRRGRAFVGIVVLLGIVVMPFLSPSTVRAQTITVHSGDVQGLKDAINTLNTVSGTNVISLDFDGDYNLTTIDNGNSTTGDQTGLPIITGTITITGAHPTIRRDSAGGTPLFRLFSVASGGTLHLDDVILSNGAVRGTNGVTVGGNGGLGLTGNPGLSGAVKNDGVLIVTESLFKGNSATGGNGGNGGAGSNGGASAGGNGGRAGDGGNGLGSAISSTSTGTLTVVNSTFTQNTAMGGHGGTGGNGGTGSSVGQAGAGGGGGTGGGAIATAGGSATIANVTIASNTGTAGAVGTAGTGSGTPAIPTPGNGAGGVDLGGGTTITNAILASNAGSSTRKGNCLNPLGTQDGGHNLEFNPTASCGLNTGAPQFDVLADPKLSALFFDFESTDFFEIQSGSGAMGAGDASVCTRGIVGSMDQRGKPRTGTTCDIGAIEAQGSFVTGSLPQFFTAGVPFTITVQVVSEFGGPLTKYAGTLHTFNADPLGSAPADYTFTRSDAGTHDFSITFGNAGDWSVIVSEIERSIAVFAQTLSVDPALLVLSPPYGSPSGGTTVTLTGTGFVAGLTTVTFDTSKATITSISNTSVTVTTSAHAEGKVAVSVVSNNHGARTSGVYTCGTLQMLPDPRAGGGVSGPPNPAANPPPRSAAPSAGDPPTPLPAPRQ
jgi:hypothetical protein